MLREREWFGRRSSKRSLTRRFARPGAEVRFLLGHDAGALPRVRRLLCVDGEGRNDEQV